MPFVQALGHRLEYDRIAGTRAGGPTLVFLHEGLGSMAMWRDFPAKLARRTGSPALVYSRYGYGKSDPIAAPLGIDYMHVEALEVLPVLLREWAVENPILVGHSDGGSIAIIHAGSGRWPVKAIILEAPHVFVEDLTIASIHEAREKFRTTDLPERLKRYHADVDSAFRGWNDVWLNPAFRSWNIESFIPALSCPVMAIQGIDDEYGTLAQLDALQRQVKAPYEQLVLAECCHAPHRDREKAVLDAMARFIERI